MSKVAVTMPRWPAYLMGAFAIACAYPAMTAPAPEPPAEPLRAESAPAVERDREDSGLTRFEADAQPAAVGGEANLQG